MRHLMQAIAALAVASGVSAAAAQAQHYPNRPIRVIVGFAAGSGPDILARAVSAQLGVDLGQSFFVENRTGANGTIGDVLRDLTPIATVGILDGYLMLVNPSLPVHTVAEFIAHAKKNRVLYGSPGVGNLLHLTAELFNVKAGISMEHVPYKGASEVVTALLQGSIQVMFVTAPSSLPLVKEGKLRAIGHTGTKPFPELPDLPLVSAALPGFSTAGSWGMFFAPAKASPAIVDKLNAAVQHALKAPAVADVVQRAGYEPDGRSAAQTAEFFRQEVVAAGEAVRAAGIQPN